MVVSDHLCEKLYLLNRRRLASTGRLTASRRAPRSALPAITLLGCTTMPRLFRIRCDWPVAFDAVTVREDRVERNLFAPQTHVGRVISTASPAAEPCAACSASRNVAPAGSSMSRRSTRSGHAATMCTVIVLIGAAITGSTARRGGRRHRQTWPRCGQTRAPRASR